MITNAKLEEIRVDEENLNRFIEMLEHGYSWLSARCNHALGGVGDGEEEEAEEEETEATFDLPPEGCTALMKIKGEDLKSFDRERFDEDDEEYFEDEVVDPNNPNEPKKREEHQKVAIGELYRMVKQLTHPDKLLRFSAIDKKKLIDIFHESTEFMEDDNLEALVFCYVKIRMIRNEPHKIPMYIESYVRERHRQILRHMGVLMNKPFTPAILEWRDGNHNFAIIMFKHYLREKAKHDAAEAAARNDDDEFFS